MESEWLLPLVLVLLPLPNETQCIIWFLLCRCFDIGLQVRSALTRRKWQVEPLLQPPADPFLVGSNGAIMRHCPVTLFFFDHPDEEEVLDKVAKASLTTHSTQACVQAAQLLHLILTDLLLGVPKAAVLEPDRYRGAFPQGVHPSLQGIVEGAVYRIRKEKLRAVSAVDKTLECALWAFYHTDTFVEGALCVANLGRDTDTVGAVYGQIAGAAYGLDAIPAAWLEALARKELLIEVADQLFKSNRLVRGQASLLVWSFHRDQASIFPPLD